MKTIILIVISLAFIFVIYCARRNHEYKKVMTVFDEKRGKASHNTRKPHAKHYERLQYNYLSDLSRRNKNGLQYVLEPLLKDYISLRGIKPSPCNYVVIKCTEKLNSGLINYQERVMYMNLRAIAIQLSCLPPNEINTALTYYKNGCNSYRK